MAELKDGQKAIGQTLVEIKDRQAAQNDMLADINVALANGFGSIKSELTSIGYGIASLNDKQAESVEILKEIAASLKKDR